MQVPENSMAKVLDADLNTDVPENEPEEDITQFCCGEATGVDMVECSNDSCTNGQWFHLDCKQLKEAPSGDWWCSDQCRLTEVSVFCVCKKHRPGLQLLTCNNKDNCLRGQKFHQTCVKGLKNSTDSMWYCCLTCKVSARQAAQQESHSDGMYSYSCALVYRGLSDAIRRDAVREGDGEAMKRFWRMDMTEFWRKNHYKYLSLGHRFLVGQNGWLPKRLAEDMLHNRTVNLRGGDGCNLEMDLVNEFLNNDFKENLKHARGMYTPTHVARTAQIVGTLGKAIDAVYHKEVVGGYIHSATQSDSGTPDIKKEVIKFVEEYKQDKLVQIIPGRQHTAFPGYHLDLAIRKPAALRQRLINYSVKLDRQRKIISKD